MRRTFRFFVPLLLIVLSACGTFQVEFQPQPLATPSTLPQPRGSTVSFPPPEECSQLPVDASPPADADTSESYIGHHYDQQDMPDGMVLTRSDALSDEYIWEWVSRPEFDLEFISQIICRKLDGSTYNTVVDAIRIPRERPGYARAGYCLPDRSSGPIIIYGKYDQNQPQVTLGSAEGWSMFGLDFSQHIDLQAMRFAPYPTDGLQCLHVSTPDS